MTAPLTQPSASPATPPAPDPPDQQQWLQATCKVVVDYVPLVVRDQGQCEGLYTNVLSSMVSALPGILFTLALLLAGLVRHRRNQAPSGAITDTPSSTLACLTARLGSRRRQRRYVKALARGQAKLTPLRRGEPLKLDDIYVGLKVAAHQAPRDRLDPPSPAATGPTPDDLLGASGRTLTLPEALELKLPHADQAARRLLILGEPGAGKSTLLKHLVLAIAQRDPRFGPFARDLVPNRTANLLEGLRRRLHGLNLALPNLLLALAALLTWLIGIFVSGAPVTHLLLAPVWFVAGALLVERHRRRRWLGLALAGLVLGYAWAGWTPVWPVAAWTTSASVVALLYPFWIVPPTWLLGALVRRRTRYPLPVLLTLNNLTGDGRSLEAQSAAAVAAVGTLSPERARRLLDCRLRAGACLLLLDGLDEVTDPVAQARVLAEIRRLRDAYGGGNQVIVTARTGGYGYPLGGWLTLEVQRFETPQIELFVRQWFAAAGQPNPAAQAQGLLATLAQKPGLRALAANPLLLALIVRLYEQNGARHGVLPERRVALYEIALDLLTEEWNLDQAVRPQPRPQAVPGAVMRCALREVAAAAHGQRLRVIPEDRLLALLADARGPCAMTTDPASLLAAVLADTGVLRRLSATSYDFAHLTFQEYLTAVSIKERGDATALLAHCGDPWWREAIRLYAGLTANPADWLQRLLPLDPLLAAGCLADARLPAGDPGAAAAAGPVVAALQGWLTDPDQDPERRQAAADALAEIGDHGARECLSQALANLGQDPAAALAALLALAPGSEATLHQRLPAGRLGGPDGLLSLLHQALPRAGAAQRGRILTLLEALGHPLCVVPAGTFRMGTDVGGSADERPAHEVVLGEYWIDRYPVTNRQFAAFAAETDFPGTAWREMATDDRQDHPVVFVSGDDATAYGAWCGKRLPTEAEWEKAARGTDGRRYPWGNHWDAERCNTAGRGTTPVGDHPGGVSPYGCHDLAGNVWEWTADWYDAGYYRRSPAENPMGPEAGLSRVVRGGAWYDLAADARAGCRNHDAPRDRIGGIGFRLLCCAPIPLIAGSLIADPLSNGAGTSRPRLGCDQH